MASVGGLDKLNAQLERLKGVNPHALLAGAFVLQRRAQDNAPVLTGFLRNSALSRVTSDGAEVVFSALYAPYVEFGTSKWAGHPFVRPAIDEHSQEIVNAVETQIQKDIQGRV